jgi:hypothetical protein
MNEDINEKFCWRFPPIALGGKNTLGAPVVNLQFIPCLKEKCAAWDSEKKKCAALRE